MTKTSGDLAALSLPKEKTVRGYSVRRLPLGAFLQAAQALETLPDDVLAAAYPGKSAGEALRELTRLTPETALPVLARAIAGAPSALLKAASCLTGIPEDALLTDPALGAEGLLEALTAAWEVNGLANFTRAARSLLARLKSPDPTGCNG